MKDILTRWHAVASDEELAEAAMQRVLRQAETAIASHGTFRIVLAGGSTPRSLYECLRETNPGWDAWHVYFGDERCAAPGDPSRNSTMASECLLDHVPIPAEQIHPIPSENGSYKAAQQYARELKGLGNFDMVLLGLGEDGHTASLFPGQYWGIERNSRAVLSVFNAPKPPPERVTLSANRLSRSANVLFLVSGEGKRQAVQLWRAGKSLPAAAIAPTSGVDVLVAADLLD